MNKLFKQYLKGICKAKDMKLLLHYFGNETYSAQLEKLIQEEFLKKESQPLPDFLTIMLRKNRHILLEKISLQTKSQNSNNLLWVSIAAALIAICSSALQSHYRHDISMPTNIEIPSDQNAISKNKTKICEPPLPSPYFLDEENWNTTYNPHTSSLLLSLDKIIHLFN